VNFNENVTPEIDLSRKPGGPAGNSNIAHLYLYEKTPSGEWPIVDGGAWGKMEYKLSGPKFDFVFNGKGLDADIEYSLIIYRPDYWPAEELIILGTATANKGGNVHIADSIEVSGEIVGVKVWLVLSSDVAEGGMTAWNPAEYLFENDLITFTIE